MKQSDEILLKAGMTKSQIDAGRMRNALGQMQRDMYIAQLVLLSGAEELKKIYPDITPEVLGQWASNTLTTARAELAQKKRGV